MSNGRSFFKKPLGPAVTYEGPAEPNPGLKLRVQEVMQGKPLPRVDVAAAFAAHFPAVFAIRKERMPGLLARLKPGAARLEP